MQIRQATADDHAVIAPRIDDWWGGRRMADMVPRLFFTHFSTTSLVAEDDGEVVGFLVGLLSQSRPDEAYVHFVGVHPGYRGQGVARRLYDELFTRVRALGRTRVRCVTSPVNRASIAFHTRLGFTTEPGDTTVGGVPVTTDYDGPGQDRVRFVAEL